MGKAFLARTLMATLCCFPSLAQVEEQQQSEPDSSKPDTSAPDTAKKELPNAFKDYRDRIFYPGDTERIQPLMTKLAENVLVDQKEIWTSPFRMHKKDAVWWLGLGAATGALIATDHRTSNVFRNSSGQIVWGDRLSQPGASYTLLPLVAGFYGYGVIFNDAKPREVGVLGGEALLDSLIVAAVLKPIAGRNRPNATAERGHFFDGGDSFPSGHTIESWALASVVAHEYQHQKLVPITAYTLAGMVSLARFAAQKHYASDILAGGAMGWFIGRYVYKTHQDHMMHTQRRVGDIAPLIEPSQRLYGVSMSFH